MRHQPLGSRSDTPPSVAEDLIAAAQAFFPDARSVSPLNRRDHLARVETPSGNWRVRRWPETTTEARVTFVHAALTAARRAGITVAPTVADLAPPASGSVLTMSNRHFDAQRWLPGRPVAEPSFADQPVDLPAALPEATFAALVGTVARIHAATAELARTPDAPTVPLTGMVGAVRQAWAAQRERLRPIAPRTPVVQRWLAVGERALPAAQAALAASAATSGAPSAIVHLGLWPTHVLLEQADGPPVGLLGWEGAAVGSPLLDLAQLVIRCRGWSAGAAEVAIAAYGAVRALSPEERRLLPAVAALDLVATAGHVLDAAHSPRPPDAPPVPAAVRTGAAALVDSLEVAAATLAQGVARPSSSRRSMRPPTARSRDSPRRERNPRGRAGEPGRRGEPKGSSGQ